IGLCRQKSSIGFFSRAAEWRLRHWCGQWMRFTQSKPPRPTDQGHPIGAILLVNLLAVSLAGLDMNLADNTRTVHERNQFDAAPDHGSKSRYLPSTLEHVGQCR